MSSGVMADTLQRTTKRAFLLAAVIPVAVVGLGLLLWFAHRVGADARARVDGAASEVAARLDLHLDRHRAAFAALVERLEQDPRLARGAGTAGLLDSVLATHPGFAALVLTDADGTVRASAPAELAGRGLGSGASLADRPDLRAAGNRTWPQLSPVLDGSDFGTDAVITLAQSHPLAGGQRGVVLAALDLAALAAAVLGDVAAGEVQVRVVDEEGVLVAGAGGPGAAPDTRLARLPEDRLGQGALVARSAAEQAPWEVLAGVDRARVYWPVAIFVSVLFAAILVLVLCAGWLFQRITTPLLAWLSGLSRELSNSKPEEIRLPALRQDAPREIADLDASLRRVLATVQRQNHRLQEHLSRLERTVEARTAEVRERNRELQHHRAVLEQFVQQAPVAIAMLDHGMRFRAVSNRWVHEFGLDSDQLIERRFTEVFPEQAGRWRERHERCLRGATLQAEEEALPRADGSLDWLRWEMHPWRGSDGEIMGTVMMTEIVTETKELKDQLRHLADHDTLTGLLNRRAFVDLLRRTLSRTGAGAEYALLFADLDDFKAVNDEHGHVVGDQVLRVLGNRLREQARAGDMAARLGGDEFVVLTRIEDPAELEGSVARYRRFLCEPVPCEDLELPVSVSVGATLVTPGASVDAMLEHADSAMYDAKRGRRQEDGTVTPMRPGR